MRACVDVVLVEALVVVVVLVAAVAAVAAVAVRSCLKNEVFFTLLLVRGNRVVATVVLTGTRAGHSRFSQRDVGSRTPPPVSMEWTKIV